MKKLIKIFLFIFILTISLFGSSQVFAAPVVTGISGTLTHGSPVTITGSGFGIKNPAAPLLWVDAETGSVADFFTEVSPSASGADYNGMFRTSIRGEAQAHSRSSRYFSGAHYPGSGSNTGYNVAAFKNFGVPLAKSFVSFYYKVDTRFAEALSYTLNDNYKMMFYQNNDNSMYGGCGTGCSYWYAENYAESLQWKAPNWMASSVSGGAGGYPQMWGGNWPQIPGVWGKYEYEAAHATSGNGASWKFNFNGSRVHTMSAYNEAFTVYGIGVGGFFRPYGKVDSNGIPVSWRYIDDIYIDNTWARVVIGNGSTWVASTIREIQIPSSWSDASINFTVNNGSFTSGQQAYLFVFDSNGVVNASGFPITIGGAPAPDTTAPSIPTNLSATAISSSQINLSWTASTDNVGVAGYRIYRCTGSGCTPTTQIATSATNSYQNTGLTANTTYVYRVAAYDAAENVSGQSSPASATTQAAPAPDTAASSQINLSWTASTDNIGVTGYRIYRAGTQIATSTTTSYSNTGLSPSTSYSYTVSAYDAAGNVSGQSGSVSATTQAASDTTPPSLSNSLPISVLASGTTQTALSLTTNENATCRYSAISGVSYASMTNTFSTTGATNHSTNISGLTSGSSYNYYVRCQDAAGNPNITDFTISFSIASAGGATIALNPIADTYIDVNYNVNATSTALNTYTWPANKIANAILMKFDLSSIPTGSTISSAFLNIYLIQSDATADATYTISSHKIINKNPDPTRATGYT